MSIRTPSSDRLDPLARDILIPEYGRPAEPAPPSLEPTPRLASVDAYRGLVMVLMVSAGLRIPQVVKTLGDGAGPVWQFLADQADHAAWVGCTLWDLIQPSFMFLVGVAVPFSLANRAARGQSFGTMLGHAVIRSLVLVLLGVFLASTSSPRTNWVFTNVLAQIGLGYAFLFLVAHLRVRWQASIAFAILGLYFALFVLYPKPGVPWGEHWAKNANLATAFDTWFLNRFPGRAARPYVPDAGGYHTLNFVPSLATMIFGLCAARLICSDVRREMRAPALLMIGAAGLAVGWALDWTGVCPMVKRIWTPSFAIFSGGWCFVILGWFYWFVDVIGYRRWTTPLAVVGANSIAIYCISQQMKPWVRETLERHLGGRGLFEAFGAAYVPMVHATLFLLFCWAIAWWMWRRKVFIKI